MMNKVNLFILFLGALIFVQCTPKTAQITDPSAQEFRKKAPAPGPAPVIQLGDYDRLSLDNGLEIIVVENHKLPQVSFQVFVDAPLIDEGDAAGYLSLAGQMLTQGTANRSKAEIDEAVDFIGASLSSSSSGLFGACLTKHTDALLDVMQEVLFEPSFPEEQFEKLKKQTLSSLAQQKEDPNSIASNVGSILRYGKDHPYGQVETEASIEKITLDQCKNYYQNYFKPNVSYLVVVGDITSSEAKDLANKYFGSWKKGDVKAEKFETPKKPEEARLAFVDKAGAVQSVISVTYAQGLDLGHPDRIKASVMNTALGGYFRSRLNNNLREDKGYTYGARSTLQHDKHIGYFDAYASVRNEVTDSSLTEFMYELNRLRNEKMETEELNLVKNYVSGNFSLALESPQTIARFALNIARYNLPEDFYATYLEKVAAVTAEDIQAMAKKYITPENAFILVVGNKNDVAESLVQFDANEEIEFFDPYGNPVAQEGLEIPEGATAETVIRDYIEAIGGEEKVAKVENVLSVMEADSPMGKIEFKVAVQKPYQFYSSVAMGGMVMQEQVLNGDAGKMVAGGQNIPMEPEQIADMKGSAVPFNVLNYLDGEYKLNLTGMEKVEGEKAFVIEVEAPSGKKHTEYYSFDSGLKIRELNIEQQGEQTMTIIQDYANYKEVDGVLFPHAVALTGAMPVPLQMKMKSIEVNAELDDAMFKVE